MFTMCYIRWKTVINQYKHEYRDKKRIFEFYLWNVSLKLQTNHLFKFCLIREIHLSKFSFNTRNLLCWRYVKLLYSVAVITLSNE